MLEVKIIQIHIMLLNLLKMGADSVTIHLREDRRHINDLDAKKICSIKNFS
jgi:pyridoxine 5'-phosphate synthase PdxJ